MSIQVGSIVQFKSGGFDLVVVGKTADSKLRVMYHHPTEFLTTLPIVFADNLFVEKIPPASSEARVGDEVECPILVNLRLLVCEINGGLAICVGFNSKGDFQILDLPLKSLRAAGKPPGPDAGPVIAPPAP